MSRDKPLTSDEYANQGGNCCPYCGSGDLDGGPVEIDAGIAAQKVGCGECDKEWTDTYSLTGYIE